MLATVKPPNIAEKTPAANGKHNGFATHQSTIEYDTPDYTSAEYENIDWDSIVTEDDTPVENYTTEQHYPLLTTTLYDSWSHSIHGKKFIVVADVGVFSAPSRPPIVPDVFLSLGLLRPNDRRHKRNRSYFIWEVRKPPEVAIEIISNDEGGELSTKRVRYAEIGVFYYVVFDPLRIMGQNILRIFKLVEGQYVEASERWMPEIELGLTIWEGEFQGNTGEWLRWCDRNGTLIPTGGERAEQEAYRAEQAALRAEQETLRAQTETLRAEQEAAHVRKLVARLHRLGLSEADLEESAP